MFPQLPVISVLFQLYVWDLQKNTIKEFKVKGKELILVEYQLTLYPESPSNQENILFN